jgi:hypothetical protein
MVTESWWSFTSRCTTFCLPTPELIARRGQEEHMIGREVT